MTVTLLIGWLLYGVGVVGLVRGRLWADRRTIWMTFTVLAGVSVAFVFFRSGSRSSGSSGRSRRSSC